MISYFESHVRNTIRLHVEIRSSGIDSDEYEKIKEELDVSWVHLTESEIETIGLLSELVIDLEDEIRGKEQ